MKKIKSSQAGCYKVTFSDTKEVIIVEHAKHGIDAKYKAAHSIGRSTKKYIAASTEPYDGN